MSNSNNEVAKQIEQALGEFGSNKINIHRKLVENTNDSSLYEYLKNIIEEELYIENIYDIKHAIYFENNLLKGVFFGEFYIQFDAKNFLNLFDGNSSIRIRKDNSEKEEIIIPASKNCDYIVKEIKPTQDKQDKTISYAFSNGKMFQEVSFDIKRPYMDYFVNKITHNALCDNKTNIFIDDNYYCTSKFGGITNYDNGILERIKTLQEVDKGSFYYYNSDEEKLKKEIIRFSIPLMETFNNIEKKIKEAVKQYPFRIVDYNEIKFSDEESKEKIK